MKKRILFLGSAVLFFSLHARAQTAPTVQTNSTSTQTAETQTSTVDPQTADVSITANVTAKEIKFDAVPNPTVKFLGEPKTQNIWEADRQNLPKPVEPGVTYRNIGIQLRIASRLADIDRIVSEALGETPIAETETPPTEPVVQTKDNKASAQTASTAKPARRSLAKQRRAQ